MLKLYGGLLTRAFIVPWYLEELAVKYEFVQLNMQTGAHLQPDFLSLQHLSLLNLANYPGILSYINRLGERPAFQKTIASSFPNHHQHSIEQRKAS